MFDDFVKEEEHKECGNGEEQWECKVVDFFEGGH